MKKVLFVTLFIACFVIMAPQSVKASLFDVDLNDDGIKFIDIDKIITEGTNPFPGPIDPNPSPVVKPTETPTVKPTVTPTVTPTPLPTKTPEDTHITIRVKGDTLYINGGLYNSTELFKETIKNKYKKGDKVDIEDEYADYHKVRFVKEFLKSQEIEYNQPKEID